MNAETDFHRRRKAFVLFKDTGILLAQDGFAGSHFDLLRAAGFVESQAKNILETQPRGYALDGNVYFYQGEGFHVLDSNNKKTAQAFLDFFKKQGLLTARAYDGMTRGPVGQSWVPVRELQDAG